MDCYRFTNKESKIVIYNMTVSYSRKVSHNPGTKILFKLLVRWRGSIYKHLWCDLLISIFLYTILSMIYRFGLSEQGMNQFEKVSLLCKRYADWIPVGFILGFYVTVIMTRWWQQYETIPWPDSTALWLTNCIQGHDERGRLMRRTIMRYINLSLILTFRLICNPVEKRFPNYKSLVEAGIMTKQEQRIMESMDKKAHHPKYWIPLVWAGSIITNAKEEKRLSSNYATTRLMEKLDDFRALTGGLLNYDWVNVPLAYTQVVTLAVYSYVLAGLMGGQYLDIDKENREHGVDLAIPLFTKALFTIMQFFFYVGWLKVAGSLIHPFGESDDDFEINWVIDRNIQVSYMIVDEMHLEHPVLVKDQFWDSTFTGMSSNEDMIGRKPPPSYEDINIQDHACSSNSGEDLCDVESCNNLLVPLTDVVIDKVKIEKDTTKEDYNDSNYGSLIDSETYMNTLEKRAIQNSGRPSTKLSSTAKSRRKLLYTEAADDMPLLSSDDSFDENSKDVSSSSSVTRSNKSSSTQASQSASPPRQNNNKKRKKSPGSGRKKRKLKDGHNL